MDDREQAALARWQPANTVLNRSIAKAVTRLSQLVVRGLNRLQVDNIEAFEQAQRRQGVGLLTFSNHVSLFDDPWLTSAFGLYEYERIRWVAADAVNFFGTAWKGKLYSAGKCVPIVRGAGIDQPGFHFLRERLLAGEWVHIFPEGGRTRDPQARLRHPFKSGIGRLLLETRPLALPFYHAGLDAVLPLGASWPRALKTIRCRFGEATAITEAFVRDVSAKWAPGQSTKESWVGLAEWAYQELLALQGLVRPELVEAAPAPADAGSEV